MGTRKHTKRALYLIASLCVTFAFFGALFAQHSVSEWLAVFSNVSLSGVFLYTALSVLGVVLRSIRYRILLISAVGANIAPPPLTMLAITFLRNALVDLLPARAGELGYFALLKRHGIPLASGAANFGSAFFLDVTVLFGLLIALCIAEPLFLGQSALAAALPHGATLVGIAGLCLILMFSIIGLARAIPRLCNWLQMWFECLIQSKLRRHMSASQLSRLEVVRGAIIRVGDDFEHLMSRAPLSALLLLTLALRVAKYASLYVLLLATVAQWNLGAQHFSFTVTIIAFVLAEGSASLPISGLMGFGAYETTWTAVFHIAQVQLPYAAPVALTVHLISQLKGYTLGALAAFFLASNGSVRR